MLKSIIYIVYFNFWFALNQVEQENRWKNIGLYKVGLKAGAYSGIFPPEGGGLTFSLQGGGDSKPPKVQRFYWFWGGLRPLEHASD